MFGLGSLIRLDMPSRDNAKRENLKKRKNAEMQSCGWGPRPADLGLGTNLKIHATGQKRNGSKAAFHLM